MSGEGILNGYIAAVMPEIWHSYTCSPCRSALARGGDWAEVNCPSCGRSMQRLAEHALHPSRESLGWTSPPPDCPVTGWPQIDRDDLDMCSCGHRHITIEAIAGGGPK